MTLPTPERVLLPCPFCGGTPIAHAIEPHKHELSFGGFKMPDHAGSFVIECARCECGMIAGNQDSAYEAWNRRAVASPTCKRCGGPMLLLDGEWECHNVAPAIAPTPSAQAKCEGNGAPTHDAYHDSIGETK